MRNNASVWAKNLIGVLLVLTILFTLPSVAFAWQEFCSICNETTEQYVDDEPQIQYKQIVDGYHIKWYGTMVYCEGCRRHIRGSEMISEVAEDHTFVNGVCICGAKGTPATPAPCDHGGTTVYDRWTEISYSYTQFNDANHITVTTYDEYCICGEIVNSSSSERVEGHSFSGNKCRYCGYEKPVTVTPAPPTEAPSTPEPTVPAEVECQHTDTEQIWVSDSIAEYNEDMHQVTTWYEVVCSCGETVKPMYSEIEYVPHAFVNGSCICGANENITTPMPCAHDGDTVNDRWAEVSDDYLQFDDANHIVLTISRIFCPCGVMVDENSWERVETHNFKGNVCQNCGYERTEIVTQAPPTEAPVTIAPTVSAEIECQHELAERSVVSNSITDYDADWHQIITWYEVVCSCGTLVKPLYSETEYFLHTFEDDACVYCGRKQEFFITLPNDNIELIRSQFTVEWTPHPKAVDYRLTIRNMATGDYITKRYMGTDVTSTKVTELVGYAGVINCDGIAVRVTVVESGNRQTVSDERIYHFMGYEEHDYGKDGICRNCRYNRQGDWCRLTNLDMMDYADAGRIPPDVFDMKAIKHVYYLRSVFAQSHTALLLIDENGHGLHYSYYGDGSNMNDTPTNLGLSILTKAEVMQFYQTGGIYLQPASNMTDLAAYDTYYDMIDVACLFSESEKELIVMRCLNNFSYAYEQGIDYNVLVQNCDDLAYYALYGEFSQAAVPSNTFGKLWEDAQASGGTYRRVDHPNAGPDSSSFWLDTQIDTFDEYLEQEAESKAMFTGVLVTEQAILRADASVTSEYVQIVEAGMQLDYIGVEGNWYKVQTADGIEAYIIRDKCVLE